MKKETKLGIAKWLSDGNTGISSEAVLTAFLANDYLGGRWGSNYPHDNSDFNRVYKLVEYAPEVFKGIKILAKHFEQWKNILKFWDELIYIFKKNNKDFYDFIHAVNNDLYGNTNYQKQYDERQKKGREIYKKYGFSGKRLPKAPTSK